MMGTIPDAIMLYIGYLLINFDGGQNMSQKAMLWCRVSVEVKSMVERLASSQGITVSEYIRNLVLKDLDERSVFTRKLKEAV